MQARFLGKRVSNLFFDTLSNTESAIGPDLRQLAHLPDVLFCLF